MSDGGFDFDFEKRWHRDPGTFSESILQTVGLEAIGSTKLMTFMGQKNGTDLGPNAW